ncbi:MAG: clan AA aspartic protease [Lyngbya sp. HA4199-MV5]|jgi:clan AA aspartic protease|nr:clan AA aspartic protease [Lyngbya sp. HA4199-MV5]
MMEGVVNLRREATLTVVIGNSKRQLQAIDAVIDTGFNGFLSLPPTIITMLNLPWSGSDFVTLGYGSETYFDLYTGTVIWDGQYQEIDIAESETEPLLGTGLLYWYRLRVDSIKGGKVGLKPCELTIPRSRTWHGKPVGTSPARRAHSRVGLFT